MVPLTEFYQGTATREDIDTTLKLGMNHPMGPLQLGKFICYYDEQNSNISIIQRICAFLMTCLNFLKLAKVLILASVLTPA